MLLFVLTTGMLMTAAAGTFYFYRLRKKKSAPLQEEQKYGGLVQMLSSGREVVSTRYDGKEVLIRIRKERNLQQFAIREVNGKMLVVWTLDSQVHGKRGKEWSFAITDEPLVMGQTINKDLEDYEKSLYRER